MNYLAMGVNCVMYHEMLCQQIFPTYFPFDLGLSALPWTNRANNVSSTSSGYDGHERQNDMKIRRMM